MKILQKLLIILVISVFTIGIMPQVQVQAKVTDTMGLVSGADISGASGVEAFVNVMEKVLGIIQVLSGIMAIVTIAWTGFKFIIETAEMKAQLKDRMIPIIIGALLVFGATSIAKFIISVTSTAK